MNKEEIKNYLTNQFPNAHVGETFDFPLLVVDKNDLIGVLKHLNENEATRFDFLFCQTAVDRKTHFEVIYHLNSTHYRHDLEVKVLLNDRDHSELESVYSLWKAAEYYENEIFDMFGIRFNQHPNLRRMILGDEWQGYPLRKDYSDDKMLIA